MFAFRGEFLLFIALLLIININGERARNDHLQDEDSFSDERDEVIETMKRFLTKKKTTTPKPSSDAISALITTTRASKITPTKSSFTSGSTTSGFNRPKVTPSPTKDACGLTNPCKNGGSCKTLSSGRYYCFCTQDYYGKNCENKFMSTGADNRDRAPVDHCAKNPCRNNGECVGLRTTYYCRCKSPYYGTTCDKRINKREELIDNQSNSAEEELNAYERDLEEDRDDLRRALAEEIM